MSLFWIYAAALVLLALAMVLPTLLKRRNPEPNGSLALGREGDINASTDLVANSPQQTSLAILREQLLQIDADLQAGRLDLVQHAQAKAEIERRALEESAPDRQLATTAPVGGPASRSTRTAAVVTLVVGAMAGGLYGLLGNPQALSGQTVAANAPGGPEGEVTAEQFEAMVAKLAQRLENPEPGQPVDPKAWEMLARTYAAMQRFAEADRAFKRATELAPDNAQLWADHADVMAMLQGQSALGAPEALIARALKLDPQNIKALALAGSAAYERKDFAGATQAWSQARKLAPVGSEFAAGLDRSLEAAQAGQSGQTGQVAAAAPSAPIAPAAQVGQAGQAAQAAPAAPISSASTVSGVVSLSPALAGKASPDDTVFIFARAAEGPRMPLAILKRKVSDLPITFKLDDSTAMAPEMKLSKFPQVVVGARVSKSGNAMPQSGDLVGQMGPLKVGTSQLKIAIDAVQP